MTAIWFCCACVGGGVAQLDVSGCMRGRISEVWPPTMVLLASDYSPEFFFTTAKLARSTFSAVWALANEALFLELPRAEPKSQKKLSLLQRTTHSHDQHPLAVP